MPEYAISAEKNRWMGDASEELRVYASRGHRVYEFENCKRFAHPAEAKTALGGWQA